MKIEGKRSSSIALFWYNEQEGIQRFVYRRRTGKFIEIQLRTTGHFAVILG